MATRTLSRRAMREQRDHAEKLERLSAGAEEKPVPAAGVKKTRTRKAAAAKPVGEKVPPKPPARPKKVKVPPRMVARWAVCDGGLKRLAVFEYKDRASADTKLSQIQDQRKGTFVLQLVKDPPEAEEPDVVT